MRLFADDCFLYCRINSPVDCQNIQKDLDALTKWEKDWQMSFGVDKCHTICFSTKKSNLDTTYVLICPNSSSSPFVLRCDTF